MKLIPVKYLLLSVILICGLSVHGQERLKFQIESFGQDVFDTSASSPKYEKFDGNGDRYAIIKVRSSNPDDDLRQLNFNFGNMKHEVKDHDGELWVYVQRNAKTVTITRDGYAPISRYDLRTTIEPGKNYVMTIRSEEKKVYTQMTQFDIMPADTKAVVTVKPNRNGATEEYFGTTDETGSVARTLEYGIYDYKVVAPNYYPAEGRFTLDNRNTTFIEKVTLRPNFSDVTFTVDADADIYINGEKKGVRQWSGILKAGRYEVECRQANHKSTTLIVTVADNDNRTIALKAPVPIVGMAAVTSVPLGAEITIGGKSYGQTPKTFELPIGRYEVTLSKTNYLTDKQQFEIKEDRTTDVSTTLGRVTKATVRSNPNGAALYIDNTYKGTTPYEFEGEVGNHQLRISAKGFKELKKDVYFGDAELSVFNLQRQYVQKTDLYIEGGINVGSSMGIALGTGAHIGNFNAEIDYGMGLQTSPVVYWNYTGDDKDVMPDECTYKASMNVGIKLGYGIIAGTRLKVTPQVGAKITKLSENCSGTQYHIKGANCVDATVGVRAYYAIGSYFGVSLTPEYAVAVSKSNGLKTLMDLSSKIKNMTEGFNAKIALVATF